MVNWLVTGASSGIGYGTALAALKAGNRVAVTSRSLDKLKKLTEEYPDQCFPVELELSSPTSIEHAIKKLATFGPIDVLVNNAGHGYRAAVEEGEDEQIREIYATNLFGPIKLIQQFLPHMRQQHGGAIINISSIAAVQSGVGSGYYASTKAALEQISRALQEEVTSLGIKVMIVEPGGFRTAFYGDNLQGTHHDITDYAATAWKTHKENVKNDHREPGDPLKAGQVIVDVISKDNPPQTLLLGSDAVEFVSEELKQRLQEIRDWQDISKQTDY